MQQNYYQQPMQQHSRNAMAIIFGITLMIFGVLMLLAVFQVSDFVLFRMIDRLASGLAGSLKMLLPVFFIWSGVIVTFSHRINTYRLAFFLLLLLYLEVLAIFNIGSTVKAVQTNETFNLLDYVAYLNGDAHKKPDFFKYFSTLYHITSQDPYYAKVGGALGVIFAWPLWYFLDAVLSTVLISIITFITLSVFIKFIILDKINKPVPQYTQEQLYQMQYQEYLRQYYQNNPNYYYPSQQDAYEPAPQQMPPTYAPFPDQAPAAQETFVPNNSPEEPNKKFFTPEEEPINIKNPLPKSAVKSKKKSSAKAKQDSEMDSLGLPGEEQGNVKKSRVRVVKKEEVDQTDSMPPFQPQFEEVKHNFADLNAASASKPRDSRTFVNPGQSTGNPFAPPQDAPRKEAVYEQPKPIPQAVPSFVPPATPSNLFGGMQTGKRLDNLVPNLDKQPKKQDYVQNVTTQYVYPKSTLLENPTSFNDIDPAFDMERAKLLEDTLESFGITTTVANVTHGPAVTRFELDLASGINVKRINNVADNIALNMSAESGVRIEAPIPGTTFVGIEIPNKKINPVSFKEVMYSREMLSEKDPLAIALGKDISGKPVICNLAQMPHLLIAGATGSGKSVCINSIITSIVFRCSPEDCRLILIDPKMVELQRYNVLPHLLIPVVCEPHKASGALSWALAEMTDRYNRFKDCAVSNIQTYNSSLPPGAKKLPRIVVVVDELADLMISSSRKEIEHDINRIAALARAAGIHLVVATQRPSVDVITGVIKANLLSRIAFLSSSATDSRTILDRSGAENLVGNGDMLYMPSGYKNPLRVQGCFLKNNEINSVLDYIRSNSKTNFDVDAIEAIESTGEDDKAPMEEDSNKTDPLLEEAIDMVISDGQASISMLQRRMSIGYARAGRLIDAMTKRGVISKAAGSKPREVLMSRAEYEQIRDEL